MIAASLLTLAIVTQDQASLRAAPRDAAVQQATLWQGDTLEIRGQRMDYLQVYDHRRERAGYIHISQVRTLSLKPADAPELLTVVRFLRETPGAEALGIGYTAAYLKAAPADAIGAEVFDALGTMAERLARRASMKHPKATSDVISAHTEVAAVYGVTFKGYEQGGAMQLCYTGDTFQRILALPVAKTVSLSAAQDVEFRAHAALAVTRHDCMATDMHPQARLAHDKERIDLLDKVSPTQFAQLSEVSKNRLRLRRAGVSASLAFQQARRAELPTAAGQRSLTELAAVNKAELTDNDLQEYNETAIRVGASRWAAETAKPSSSSLSAKLTVVTEPGQAGETCVSLFENTVKPTKELLIKRCTYGIVWSASAAAHPNGQALALAVQPLDTWRELWVFRKTAGQWTVDVLPPASSSPELGYIEFAGWVQGALQQMLLARETKITGRQKRSFEVVRIHSLIADKQASDSSLLVAFTKWQDTNWKRNTVSLR
jgi:hypothetical protein